MRQLILSMQGMIQRARGYGQDGFELKVTVTFDAVQWNSLKKRQDPLAVAMPQIKNVVLDACGVRGLPSYSPLSMRSRYPRAKNGTVTLSVYFDVSPYQLESMGLGPSKALGFVTQWVSHAVDLNTTLEATRQNGHLLAKTALASHFGH